MTHFVGLLDGRPGAYGIILPDLPGCVAMGHTIDEARLNAIEVMANWIIDLGGAEAGPVPRSLEEIQHDPKSKRAISEGASYIAIPLLIESGRSVRANISMDQGILAAIDAAAAERGLTRSSFLTSAALEKIRAEGRSSKT